MSDRKDTLTLCGEQRLRELLKAEAQLSAALRVVERSRAAAEKCSTNTCSSCNAIKAALRNALADFDATRTK